MTEVNKHPLDTSHIVYTVGTSEAYVHARNQAEALDLDDSGRRRAAIRMAATALSGEQESGYLTPEGHAMNVTAHLTDFSDSIQQLHELRHQHAHHKEKLPALRKISEFNHAVKDMVDANPSLTFDEVLSFILSMNQSINGNNNTSYNFEEEVKQVLVGMSHEIAFEQMLGYMPDIEYKEATIEDDLAGTDMFVSMNGSPMVSIDIKASLVRAQHAKDKALYLGYNPDRIIWSRLSNRDFNGFFRIPQDVAEERAVALHDDLVRAINSETVAVEQVA
ncbi:MAG TPA: hypothetical protein VIM31_03370 [Candidatus Microsaccharimonas sp.]|jgi:hypothetical protein